ncbi:MAG: hypothetical protein ACKO5F_13175 [Synechococcus sp.]
MNPSSPSSQLLRVTGLWASTSKNGRRMLSGQVTPGLKLLVLENPQATGNQPKWEAFLAPAEKREQQASQPSQELF